MWAAPAGAYGSYGGLHTIWNDYLTYLGGYDVSWGIWIPARKPTIWR